MEVNILQMLDGAKQAKGVVVVIDVFRAFSFECYAFANGAKMIIPVDDIERAHRAKEINSEFIIAGERNGVQIERSDYGNSPSQIEKTDFKKKVIVHTTSAGTQGLYAARHANEVLTGALVNAKAVARYIRKKNPHEVSLVAIGVACEREAPEDVLCANYIKALLEDKEFCIEYEIKKLRETEEGQKFFLNSEMFPERDFHLCVDFDKFDFVIKLIDEDDGVPFLEKIDA